MLWIGKQWNRRSVQPLAFSRMPLPALFLADGEMLLEGTNEWEDIPRCLFKMQHISQSGNVDATRIIHHEFLSQQKKSTNTQNQT